MEAGQVILSRGLPKTGQLVSYQDYDDGWFQAGWWQGIKEPRTRFVAKTIGDNGDDVVIDLATGLMWAADGNDYGCGEGLSTKHEFAINVAEALDFAGFDDWRLPNITELKSIVNHSLNNPSIDEPPFANTGTGIYWTSTTDIVDTAKAWFVSFATGAEGRTLKSTIYRLRCVRGGV